MDSSLVVGGIGAVGAGACVRGLDKKPSTASETTGSEERDWLPSKRAAVDWPTQRDREIGVEISA